MVRKAGMQQLSGKISDRIRSGELDSQVDINIKGTTEDPPPDPKYVRGGYGQGLGKGSTRRG